MKLAHHQHADAPALSGYRMPAEWEPHQATWIGWPHNRSDWPGKMASIQWVYGEIVRHIVPAERVRVLVNSEYRERQARRILRRVGVAPTSIDYLHIPTNRGWTRDFGPIFIRSDIPQHGIAVAAFRFNAWAKYADWDLDQHVPERAAAMIRRPLFRVSRMGKQVVLEGGAIDVNGAGSLITTEECMLDDVVQVRNPGLTRHDLETVFHNYLGAANIIWLHRGIAGDDTHGHIDDICRFVDRTTVILCQETNPQDANHYVLEENRERLESSRLEDGSKIDIIRLPMPEPLYLDRCRLPASYANFYIANRAVLVPTFNDPNDRLALGIIADLFPDRRVIGIHSVDLVLGLGAIHCLTQQEPACPGDTAQPRRD